MSAELEVTADQYDQVNERLGVPDNLPDGFIAHTAEDLGGGKLRIVDVWESADAFAKFAQELLGPATAAVVGDPVGPTNTEMRELYNVIVR